MMVFDRWTPLGLILFSVLWATTAEAGVWGEYHIGSNHLNGRTYVENGVVKQLNERNTGLGVSYAISPHAEVTAGFYRNSYNKTSRYAGVDFHTSTRQGVRVGVMAGPLTGYDDTPEPAKWMVMPNVTWGTKHLRTRVGFVPLVDVLTLSVGIGF
jgi:hypothetical protein